ncbi:MAG: hypothetical protein Q9207_004686 [Kuettlingeria erythrocarpa]
MDDMYFTEGMTYAPKRLGRPPGPQDLNRLFNFRQRVTASLILTWMAMMAVKFSFLALFKRLIDRMHSLNVYWWVVVAFNLAVTGYGAAVYIIPCPEFRSRKVVNCLAGDRKHRAVQYAISQLVLDVVGDLLILYIPLQLIWQVKLRLTQKFVLACSLCLTVIVIIFTVTRASGLEWRGKLDVLWEVYFQVVAAEVGLILVSTTAFRALFVSRANQKQNSPQNSPSIFTKTYQTLKRILDPRRWTSSHSKKDSDGHRERNVKEEFDGKLPNIPAATMTGMQTFVDDHGVTTRGNAELSVIGSYAESGYDTWSPAEKRCFHCGQAVPDNGD